MRLAEEVVAPGDGCAHRTLALRQVARAAREEAESVAQPLEHRLRRQDPDPGCGKLDGERQAIQTAADRCHRLRVGLSQHEGRLDRLGTAKEEVDRRVRGHSMDRKSWDVARGCLLYT